MTLLCPAVPFQSNHKEGSLWLVSHRTFWLSVSFQRPGNNHLYSQWRNQVNGRSWVPSSVYNFCHRWVLPIWWQDTNSFLLSQLRLLQSGPKYVETMKVRSATAKNIPLMIIWLTSHRIISNEWFLKNWEDARKHWFVSSLLGFLKIMIMSIMTTAQHQFVARKESGCSFVSNAYQYLPGVKEWAVATVSGQMESGDKTFTTMT